MNRLQQCINALNPKLRETLRGSVEFKELFHTALQHNSRILKILIKTESSLASKICLLNRFKQVSKSSINILTQQIHVKAQC